MNLRANDLRTDDLRAKDLRASGLRGNDLRNNDLRSDDLSGRDILRSRVFMRRQRGVTLIEMIAVITIILILMGAAMPIMKVTIRRQREVELRRDLWEMRAAIDRYKDAADKNAFQIKLGSEGYPPDLDTLVNGVEIAGGKKLRFLRRIPVDPMTGNTDWGLRSMQDDPQSDSWGGQNVFDVYTKSTGTALNDTKYKDW